MKNILNWDNVLPTKIVQDLMLDGVLNRHLVLSLQCSVAVDSATLSKCKSVKIYFYILSEKIKFCAFFEDLQRFSRRLA